MRLADERMFVIEAKLYNANGDVGIPRHATRQPTSGTGRKPTRSPESPISVATRGCLHVPRDLLATRKCFHLFSHVRTRPTLTLHGDEIAPMAEPRDRSGERRPPPMTTERIGLGVSLSSSSEVVPRLRRERRVRARQPMTLGLPFCSHRFFCQKQRWTPSDSSCFLRVAFCADGVN